MHSIVSAQRQRLRRPHPTLSIMAKQLEMHNGDVRDAKVCAGCQTPGASRLYRGEWYCPECYRAELERGME